MFSKKFLLCLLCASSCAHGLTGCTARLHVEHELSAASPAAFSSPAAAAPAINPEVRARLEYNALAENGQRIALGAGDRFAGHVHRHYVAMVQARSLQESAYAEIDVDAGRR